MIRKPHQLQCLFYHYLVGSCIQLAMIFNPWHLEDTVVCVLLLGHQKEGTVCTHHQQWDYWCVQKSTWILQILRYCNELDWHFAEHPSLRECFGEGWWSHQSQQEWYTKYLICHDEVFKLQFLHLYLKLSRNPKPFPGCPGWKIKNSQHQMYTGLHIGPG